ncbi:uncharacterized protein FA14DRAFT_4831 [Meira miltonrushii]|uniref:Uncharacterized protein n=1 Tax=Meira miltonrushii TaxID=1280837 RepID=A0A316VG66_9BASI|nr:uncharacterized protein FA14DRAFT_4831 [Meira miltonrushii]PWN36619.1 hypothetical protein FA14DRAFT_4831 [Meira miltonrushii]
MCVLFKMLFISYAFFALYIGLVPAACASKEAGSGSKSHSEKAAEAESLSDQHRKTAEHTFYWAQGEQNANDRYAYQQARKSQYIHRDHQKKTKAAHEEAHKEQNISKQ